VLEIVHTFLNPNPISQSGEDEGKDTLNETDSVVQDDETLSHAHTPSASLNFTTASEIDRHPEAPALALEDSAEWDQVEEATATAHVDEPVVTELEESMVDVTINGHAAPSQAEVGRFLLSPCRSTLDIFFY
jgi:hypothetical protein